MHCSLDLSYSRQYLTDAGRRRHPNVMIVTIGKRGGENRSYPQILWKRLWKGGLKPRARCHLTGLRINWPLVRHMGDYHGKLVVPEVPGAAPLNVQGAT